MNIVLLFICRETTGISSSEIRSENQQLNIGLLGGFEETILNKYYQESTLVNGITVTTLLNSSKNTEAWLTEYEAFLNDCDAVYILSHPSKTLSRDLSMHWKRKACSMRIASCLK